MEGIKGLLDVLLEIVGVVFENLVELRVLRVDTGKKAVDVCLEFIQSLSLRFCEGADCGFESSEFRL